MRTRHLDSIGCGHVQNLGTGRSGLRLVHIKGYQPFWIVKLQSWQMDQISPEQQILTITMQMEPDMTWRMARHEFCLNTRHHFGVIGKGSQPAFVRCR